MAFTFPRAPNLTSGTLAANLHIVGPTNRLVTTGTVGLFNLMLSGFDLGAEMRAISAFPRLFTGRNVDIETLTTNLRITPDGLRFDHFNAVVPALGYLTVAGTIDARNHLDFKMVATLTGPSDGGVGTAAGTARDLDEQLGTITGRGSVGSRIQGQIPFLVQGTTSNPEFVPDVSGLALEILKQQAGTQDAYPLGALEPLFKMNSLDGRRLAARTGIMRPYRIRGFAADAGSTAFQSDVGT